MGTFEVLWIVRMVLEGERVVTIGYRSMSTSARFLSQRQEFSVSNAAKKKMRQSKDGGIFDISSNSRSFPGLHQHASCTGHKSSQQPVHLRSWL